MHYEQRELIPEESTSSWEARPASVRPLLESVLEMATRVTDGLSSFEPCATLDQDGSWLKTHRGYCQLTMDGSLETYSGSWPRAGILRHGSVGALETWERRTRGNGFSYWPTPTIHGNYNRKGSSEKAVDGLATAVNWPTPKAQNARGNGERHGEGGVSLDVAVGGPLNPDWIECLQGYPQGWTELPNGWKAGRGPRRDG